MATCKKCGKVIPDGETKCKQCKQKGKEFVEKFGKTAVAVVIAVVGIGVKVVGAIAKSDK